MARPTFQSQRLPVWRVAGLALTLSVGLPAQSVKDAAGPKYVFPVDAAAIDERGKPLYVKDEAIRTAIPGWRDAGKRLGTCPHFTVYRWTPIVFSPRVTGSHTAFPRTLTCEFDSQDGWNERRGNLICTIPADLQPVYFDRDPGEYFSLGANTSLDEALEVVRALRNGEIPVTDADKLRHFKSEYRVGSVEKKGDQFMLQVKYHTCYNEGQLVITWKTNQGRKRFVAVYSGPAIIE